MITTDYVDYGKLEKPLHIACSLIVMVF